MPVYSPTDDLRRKRKSISTFTGRRIRNIKRQYAARQLDHMFWNNALYTPELSIPGIRKIFSPNVGYFRKFAWIIVLFSCSVVCVLQVHNRVEYYFKHPVTVDVTMDIVRKVTYPALVLCPARMTFIGDFPEVSYTPLFEQAAETYCQQQPTKCPNKSTEAVKHIPFKDLNLTLEMLWSEFGSHLSITESSCFDGDHCHMETHVKKHPVNAVIGRCLGVKLENSVPYQGSNTFIEIVANNTDSHIGVYGDTRLVAFWFYFHKPGLAPMYDIYSTLQSLPQNQRMIVRLEVKKFEYINRVEQPCLDEEKAIKCKNTCVLRKFEQIFPCNLPYTNFPSLHGCDNWNESVRALLLGLFSSSGPVDDVNCTCPRPCTETIYTVIASYQAVTIANMTILEVGFLDNLVNVVTEKMSYGLNALVSDIGGSLGFFLGISLLTVAELIDETLYSVWNTLMTFGIWQKRKRSNRKSRSHKAGVYVMPRLHGQKQVYLSHKQSGKLLF